MADNGRLIRFGLSIAFLMILWPILIKTDLPYKQGIGLSNPNALSVHHKPITLINKVTLTQRGYIQFLRYITKVPKITEFTFCIWLRSANLTYAHPILSYSKNEESRYIRAWISAHGKEINLAILENEVFKVPVYLRENHWYHICQSWESQGSTWSFYLNGKLKLSGREDKLKYAEIPEGGDIVVGQEYTDFDKGLDDGIEGDIFGFNLILASTTTSPDLGNNLISPYEFSQRRVFIPNYLNHYVPRQYPNHQWNSQEREEIPSVLSYFTGIGTNRAPKGFLQVGQNLFGNFLDWLHPQQRIRIKTIEDFNREGDRRFVYYQNSHQQPFVSSPSYVSQDWASKRIIGGNSRVVNDIAEANHKPLGLQLVELSHNCALGKGSPINHEKVLVSWTKTPVRVFGGAILKNVPPFCLKL